MKEYSNLSRENSENILNSEYAKQSATLLKTSLKISIITVITLFLCYLVIIAFGAIFPAVTENNNDIYFMYSTLCNIVFFIITMVLPLAAIHIKLIFDIKKINIKEK